MTLILLFETLKGGAGSGNWGHAGIVGHRGGSAPRSLAMSRTSGRDWQERQQVKVEASKKPVFELPVNKSTEQLAEKMILEEFESREKVEKAMTELKSLLKDAPVCTRIPEDALDKILDEGRFKNQHETGTSRGLLNPRYRKEAEQRAFGWELENPEQLPLYGYFATGKNGLMPAISMYGGIKIEFDDSVKNRSTVTAGDSLRSFANGTAVGTPAKNPRVSSLDYAFESDGTLKYSTDYLEAQIHGGLTTKNIAKVHLPSLYAYEFERTDRIRSIISKLDAQNIPYEFNNDVYLND